MAVQKISQLGELTIPALDDLLVAVDISDLSMSPTGTDKKVKLQNLIGVGYFNVKDYGAVGDGVTDDLAALTATLTACPVGGTIVFDGSKTYAVSNTWIVNKVVRIQLNGATIKKADGWTANTSAVKPTVANVFIDGGWGSIDGNRSVNTGQSGPGLWTAHPSGAVRVRNLIIRGCGFHGIYNELAGVLDLLNVEVYDCHDTAHSHNASGVRMVTGVCRFINLYCHDNAQYGINVGGTGVGHYLSGIVTQHNAQGGGYIFTSAGSHGTIESFASIGDRSFGLYLQNTQDWNCGTIITAYTGGLASSESYVTGESVDSAGTGLQLENCARCLVGNHIGHGAAGYQLNIAGGSTYCSVTTHLESLGFVDSDPAIILASGAKYNRIRAFVHGGTFALSIGESTTPSMYNFIDLTCQDQTHGAIFGDRCAYNRIRVRAQNVRNLDTTLASGLVHFASASPQAGGDIAHDNIIESLEVLPAETKESGTSTAAGAPGGSLTDGSKAWTANVWVGYALKMTSGPASGQISRITSNTATVLSVSPAFSPVPTLAGGDTYIIYAACVFLVDTHDRTSQGGGNNAYSNELRTADYEREAWIGDTTTKSPIRDLSALNKGLNGNRHVRGRIKPAVSVGGGASYTPDPHQGLFHPLVATGASMTINAPLTPPGTTEVHELIVEVFNSTAGVHNVNWNAIFLNSPTWTIAAGKRKQAVFRWNGTNWIGVSVTADY